MAKKNKDGSEWQNRITRTGKANPEKLLANPRNWRIHPKYQREALKAVMDEVGWVQQIIVNLTTGLIVDGHLRVAMAIERGEKRIPVNYVELTEEEEAIVLATIDPIAAMAKADDDLLDELAAAIETDNEALQDLLNGITRDHDEDDDEDPAERNRSKAMIKKWGVKAGQTWSIGKHKLCCGNSGDPKLYKKLMGVEKAALLFTDPPYGVSYKARSGKFDDIANDELTGDALVKFLVKTLRHTVKYTRDDGAFYIWHASSTRVEFQDALRAIGLEERQYLIWVKPAAVLGWGDYRWAHEPCFYASKAGETPLFYGDRSNTTTWYVKKAETDEVATAVGSGVLLSNGENDTLYVTAKPPKNKRLRKIRLQDGATAWLYSRDQQDDVWEVGKVGKPEHPTEKPPELARRAIENSTQENEIVLDVFAGTGGTFIAAEHTGRRARGIELEPGYVAVTLERMSEMGLKPELEK